MKRRVSFRTLLLMALLAVGRNAQANPVCQKGGILITPDRCGSTLQIGMNIISKCMRNDSSAFKTLVKECKTAHKNTRELSRYPCNGTVFTPNYRSELLSGKNNGFTIGIGMVDSPYSVVAGKTQRYELFVKNGQAIDAEIRSYCEQIKRGSSSDLTIEGTSAQ